MNILDEQLIAGIIRQQKWAIDLFVHKYHGYIYSVCYNVLKRTGESEEATQDVCMKVFNKISDYNNTSALKTWIFTIAYRTAIDYKRRVKYYADETSLITYSTDSASDADIHNQEMKNNISRLLSHLNEEDAELLSLYYLNEMSIKEITEATGLTESNIKIKLFRARKELAKHVDKYFDKD